MTGVTVANAVLARRQDSEVLGLYALAGGLATPGLLSMGHSNEIFLFSYLVLLNVGALLLLALHPWKRLAWAALLGTAFYYIAWSCERERPFSLAGDGFLSGAVLRWFCRRAFFTRLVLSGHISDCQCRGDVGCAHGALRSQKPACRAALGHGCPRRGLPADGSRFAQAAALSRTNLGLGIFFMTVAVPLEFHGPVVTLCWLGESLALVALAKAGSHAVLRIFATAVLTVAAVSLLVDWIAGTPQPLAVVANMHFVTNLIGAVVFAAVTSLSLGGGPGRAFGSWNYLAGFSSHRFQPHPPGGRQPRNSPLLVLRGGLLSRLLRRLWPAGAAHDCCRVGL